MEKQSLVKFENAEIELVTSENELSEVRGGKRILEDIISSLDDVNGNCNCNCNGNSNGNK